MDATAKELVPVLDQVIEFMEEALQTKQADDTRIIELTNSLKKAKADQEQIILEKVAAAKASFMDTKIMSEALARLNGMGIIDERAMEKLASRFKSDPNAVFPIMVKMAERLLTAPGEGEGVDKEASDKAGSKADPDGWNDFIAGRPVKVVR